MTICGRARRTHVGEPIIVIKDSFCMIIHEKVGVAEGRGHVRLRRTAEARRASCRGTVGSLHFRCNIPFLNIAIRWALNSNRRRKRIPFIGGLENFP